MTDNGFQIICQFAGEYADPPVKERIGSRAIVTDCGKILLTHELNTNVYMSPGGGLEAEETLEECCKRELLEETGYKVIPEQRFVTVKEYCPEALYINNYFTCSIAGTGERHLTDIEIEHGCVAEWVEIEKALQIFGEYESKRADIRSLYLREFTVLNKYLNISK